VTESVDAPAGRAAGRVLLVDAADRILLFRGGDPARPGRSWWFTPGGGLDPGESTAQGAARELREETGLAVDPARLGAPVHADVAEFSFAGVRYRQHQEFFLLRVPAWEVDTSGFTPLEVASMQQSRWWTLGELEATIEVVYPTGLAALLRGLLGGTAC
jgi:8-oxo-dGTP pyrophosphatase MutT (NUDIX family)